MTNEGDRNESDAPSQSRGAQAEARPSLATRLFAIVLLIIVAPSLVFTGYVGMEFPSFAFILLPAFGILAFVACKGAYAMWFVHQSPRNAGWAVALVVLALLLAGFYLWLSTWIFEPIAL